MKEVVCKPTELEAVIDQLDQQASVPRRGDGHHGYYIEVEVRRHKDVNTTECHKRHTKPAARKKRQVHSGGLRPADDQKLSEHDRRNGSRVRPREDDLCGSASRDTGEGSEHPSRSTSKGTRARVERPVRNGIRPRGKARLERNRKAREKYHANKKKKRGRPRKAA